MLTTARIGKEFQQGRWTPLLRALAGNGLILPKAMFERLKQRPVAVIALGLRRLVELSYGRDPWIQPMLEALLAAQLDDGAFPGPAGGDAITTAAAASVLAQLSEQGPVARRPFAQQAYDRAMAALAAMQQADGTAAFAVPEDGAAGHMAATSAFILCLLGSRVQGVRREALLFYLNQHRRELTGELGRLWQLATLEAGRTMGAAA